MSNYKYYSKFLSKPKGEHQKNGDLLEQPDNTSDLKKKFTTNQIKPIKVGITTSAAPDRYVWHLNEETGVLQLIDEAIAYCRQYHT